MNPQPNFKAKMFMEKIYLLLLLFIYIITKEMGILSHVYLDIYEVYYFNISCFFNG